MTLDPAMQWVLDLVEKAAYPLLESLDAPAARAQYQATATALDAPPAPMDEIRAVEIPCSGGAIPARLYVPAYTGVADPLLVFYHGGGWVIGNLDSHDRSCRSLAAKAGCRVLAIDYRLAPEAKFPAAVDDAMAALAYAFDQAEALGADPERIAVGGDSAGGNLSAVVCHLAKSAPGEAGGVTGGRAPCFQLLIYPGADMAGDYPSRTENADGYLLTESLIAYFQGHYLNDAADRDDPRASPILFEDFSGLPPAHVQTAGYDPLRDEGAAYVGKLRTAGVEVSHEFYSGLMHGYFNMAGAVDPARTAVDAAAQALRAAFEQGE